MVRIITTPFITAAEIPRKPRARADSPHLNSNILNRKTRIIRFSVQKIATFTP